MKTNITLVFSIICLILTGCQQEEITTISQTKVDSIVATLKFENVNNRLSRVLKTPKQLRPSKVELNYPDIDDDKDSEISIIIAAFKIARKKYDCKRGFGICNWVWFPKHQLYENGGDTDVTSWDCYSYIEESVEGERYVEIQFAEKVSSNELSIIGDLIVDTDTEGFNVEPGDFNGMTIKKGNYTFDNNIGQYGGYRVYLER